MSYQFDLTPEERLDRFADDVKAMTDFDPDRHEREVAVNVITDAGDEDWNVDLDPLFEVARQYGVAPSEGDLSNTGVHLLRFKTTETPAVSDLPAGAIEELQEKYGEMYRKAKDGGFTAEYVTIEEFLEDLDAVLDEHAGDR